MTCSSYAYRALDDQGAGTPRTHPQHACTYLSPCSRCSSPSAPPSPLPTAPQLHCCRRNSRCCAPLPTRARLPAAATPLPSTQYEPGHHQPAAPSATSRRACPHCPSFLLARRVAATRRLDVLHQAGSARMATVAPTSKAKARKAPQTASFRAFVSGRPMRRPWASGSFWPRSDNQVVLSRG